MFTAKKQILLTTLLLLMSFLSALPVPAAETDIPLNLEYPSFRGFDLNTRQDLNEISAWFYYFFITISGVAAFFGLVSGGLDRLTSGGNPTKISEGNDKITSAIFGLIIILSSYLILKLINPELLTLKIEKLP